MKDLEEIIREIFEEKEEERDFAKAYSILKSDIVELCDKLGAVGIKFGKDKIVCKLRGLKVTGIEVGKEDFYTTVFKIRTPLKEIKGEIRTLLGGDFEIGEISLEMDDYLKVTNFEKLEFNLDKEATIKEIEFNISKHLGLIDLKTKFLIK